MAGQETFDRLVLTTGSDEEALIIERRDSFFAHVLDSLGLPPNIPFATTESYFLTCNIPSGIESGYPITDDALHRLVLFDELVAMVMDRRDDFNRHEVTFWRNTPSPFCQSQIEEIKQEEDKNDK